MRLPAAIVLFALLFAGSSAERKSYSGYKVIRTTPTNVVQLATLKKYEVLDSYSFWNEPSGLGQEADIMASQQQLASLKSNLRRLGMTYQVLIEDVANLLPPQPDGSEISIRFGAVQSGGFDFNDYHRLDDIYAYLDDLESNYPDVMKQEVSGHSVEGREIRLVTISKGGSGKKAIWIDGGIHAREWISPAVTMFLLKQVLENQSLLDHLDFYFAPVDNPDGYEYTHTDDRLWRKNRSNNGGDRCKGVDLNRNFDHLFGGDGTSSSSCSSIYHGPSAFSEPETQTMRDAIMARKDSIRLLLTLHSYAQVVGVPYGDQYRPEYPPDFDEMVALAQASADALQAVHGTRFRVGNTVQLLGPAAGATDDWAKKEAGIKYVYTVELRDTGRYGFLLPPDQIIPSGEEMWAFLKAACDIIIKE